MKGFDFMAATKTREEREKDFILRLKKIYPDYKLISGYIDSRTKVILKHKDGYEWNVVPRFLTDGTRQCPEVSLLLKKQNGTNTTRRLTHKTYSELFYKKWSKDEYEIIGKYTILHEPIEIKHLKCGKSFFPTANNMLHSSKHGCIHCYGKKARTIKQTNLDLKEKGLIDYECLKVYQKDGHSYGLFRHNCDLCENFEFEMRVSDMLSKHKQRCPKCKDIQKESLAVREIKQFLEKNNIEYLQEVKFKSCININMLSFDFYLPDYKLLIEYDGAQHFNVSYGIDCLQKQQQRDHIKDEWCKKKHKDLLRINYKQNHIRVLKKYLKENYE